MQREKASGLFDAELLGEDDAPVEDDPTLATPRAFEPPQAAASRARPAVAMMAAAVRAVADPARRGGQTMRVRSFLAPSSAVGWWLRLVVDAQSGLAAFCFIAAPFEMVRGSAASPV
jgi:hypothetical protein